MCVREKERSDGTDKMLPGRFLGVFRTRTPATAEKGPLNAKGDHE